MKLQLTAWALCLPFIVFSQPTINGDISDVLYFQVGETNANNGFGEFNDLGRLVAYTTSDNVYIGISGEVTGNDNILIFMNFSEYGGRAAGETLNVGAFAFGSGMDGARMDMEVDYAIAVNEGFTSDNLFVDVARYGTSGHISSGNAGQTDNQTGVSASINPGAHWSGSGNITVAYSNDFASNSNAGVEILIPVSTMDGVSSGATVQFFVIITSSSGFASNESIPALDFSGNPGNDYDFSSLDGQNLFTSNTKLPIELISFEAEPVNNHVNLHWTTASEINNSHFEIERSNDGSSWTTIGQISGAGTTTTAHNYTFIETFKLTIYFFKLTY